MPLSDLKVRNARAGDKPRKLADGEGLYLLIQVNGSKLWRLKYRLNGVENVFAIGKYPQVSLQQARDTRSWARALVAKGLNPAKTRKVERLRAGAAQANSFKAVADDWMVQANKLKNWSPYYFNQVKSTLTNDVYPTLGPVPIADLKAGPIAVVVNRVHSRAPSVATLILLWTSQVFRHAMRQQMVESDPTIALRGQMQKRKTKHKAAMSKSQISEFVSKLRKSEGAVRVRISIELLLYTFVRPIEVRCARWVEFDLAQAEWRIPAERMKMREPHIVPLSRQAIALLDELKGLQGGTDLLFPNARDLRRPMSATTMNRRIERMGYGGVFSAHGFRATASTILNEHGRRPDVIERQLAHQERNSVRRSYNHASYMDERREMMQWWADHIDGSHE